MNLVSKKEFSQLTGLPTNRLSVEISRGKIAIVGDKIDLDTPLNQQFLQKYKEKSVEVVSKVVSVTKSTGQFPANEIKNIDNLKKAAETDRIELDIELKKLKIAKEKGQNIPTDHVKIIVSQLGKSFISKFHIACDNFLMEIGKKKDLSRQEMAEMRGALINVINEASTLAVEEAKRAVRILQKETINKRGVGDHD